MKPIFNARAYKRKIHITFLTLTATPPQNEFDVEISASGTFEEVAEKLLERKEKEPRVLISGSAERVSALLNRMKNAGRVFNFHGRVVNARVVPTPPECDELVTLGRYTMEVRVQDLEEVLHGGSPF